MALGVGDFEGGVGEEFGVPCGGVEEVVVPGAQQGEVPRPLPLGQPANRRDRFSDLDPRLTGASALLGADTPQIPAAS